MIRELKITNLALIESLHLTLENGLTVFTGETGAGKSIILQAIQILTGGRSSASLIRSGAKTATIETLFDVPSHSKEILEHLRIKGFEAEDCLIIKRVLHHNGKSRYYINGSLATAKLVNETAEYLYSIASQREHQHLLNVRRHLDFVDTVAGLWPKRIQFAEHYNQWTSLKRQRQTLQKLESEKQQKHSNNTMSYKLYKL